MDETYTTEQMRKTAEYISNSIYPNQILPGCGGTFVDGAVVCRSAKMLRQAADAIDKNAVVVELLDKLTDYIERSCDEWYADYPNSGDSDMAFQRMMNFRMDAHEILKKIGIYDEIADNNRSIKRLQDFWWKYDGNKKKQSMLMKQIEFLKDRNKKVAEERSERK